MPTANSRVSSVKRSHQSQYTNTSLPRCESYNNLSYLMSSHTMTVTFDKSVSSSILEAGYNYNPAANNTVTVEFDQDGRDIYDILEDAGLGHLADEVVYTNYYNGYENIASRNSLNICVGEHHGPYEYGVLESFFTVGGEQYFSYKKYFCWSN